MLANFDRGKERNLWFPVLAHHGFTGLDLSADVIDHENAIDAVGYNAQGEQKLFALRVRETRNYTYTQLARYKREFTIRYSRPSGVPVEWQKLFEIDMPLLPDYFVYGWCNTDNTVVDDYVILDVPVLQQLYRQRHLDRYTGNIRTNVDRRRSQLVFIPIPNLIRLPGGNRLVAYHSENHPALVGF